MLKYSRCSPSGLKGIRIRKLEFKGGNSKSKASANTDIQLWKMGGGNILTLIENIWFKNQAHSIRFKAHFLASPTLSPRQMKICLMN